MVVTLTKPATEPRRASLRAGAVLGLACLLGVVALVWYLTTPTAGEPSVPRARHTAPAPQQPQPRQDLDDSGFALATELLTPWTDPTSLTSIRDAYRDAGYRHLPGLQRELANPSLPAAARVDRLISMALLLLYEGDAQRAYDELSRARACAEAEPILATRALSQLIFLQGLAGLRRGETENCVQCQGESACIFPISPQAVHTQPAGSRLAVRHFTEYLRRHPDDLAVRWLLNLAAMTLGEYPAGVPAEFLIPLDRFKTEAAHGIGAFRDISLRAGITRFNQAGGAIMDDFDNDGLLDLVVSTMDPAMPLALYRNQGDGTFVERGVAAGLKDQLGGLYCVQTDFNNDGWLDIFVVRGAWNKTPMRPSLLRNNGDGTFTDVTAAAGLLQPLNAITACWADFDNDGWLDLFIGCEQGAHKLYRNRGDGTFEEVAVRAGVAGAGKFCRGANWGDFDGDGYPDLLVNYLNAPPQLFRNQRDGTFVDVAASAGIRQPTVGFSCWFFDYDNDGRLDIYATAYERDLADVVRGLLGEPHHAQTGRLYRNVDGQRFEDVTKAVGLDVVTVPMGSNFADFDNDGYLDFYLGTGWPPLSALRPNRLFRNLAGQRFVDITLPSRTGHLQKGHAVACGDWDRDGHVDLFMSMGGATPGDRFHNVLFQNPGQGNHSLTVKLIGKQTNRAGIGARIKAVTDSTPPLTVYRHVTSGSSFGANPLEQTIGVGKATRLRTLEIDWPTSRTTQTFHDVPVDQSVEITEFAGNYRAVPRRRVPLPPELP